MTEPFTHAADEAGILACLAEALEEAGIDLAELPSGLTPALSLGDDLGLDSFQLMKVARHLEKQYGFRFSLADWVLQEEEQESEAFTVGSLVAFVHEALA